VISGESAAVEAAENACREAGAKKVVRLPVSGAFHSPLMEYAVDGLREGLQGIEFKDPEHPILTNVTASPISSGMELREGLLRQMVSPVRWTESMEKAKDLGVTEGFEVGAGKVLMGLMRAISRDIKITPFESPES
jgi:[acyl-carrier-protein] S-malonyltransferase